MHEFQSVLLIGFSGFLSDAAVSIAHESKSVLAIGRNLARLEDLNRRVGIGDELVTAAVDYRNAHDLERALTDHTQKHGEFDLVGVWMYRESDQTRKVLKRFLGSVTQPCRVVWIHGSAAGDPSRLSPPKLTSNKYSLVSEVILGFQVESAGSRWLTHPEICSGVETAIFENKRRHIVGTVTPWSARP